jgi:hypothetical protein
MCEAALSQPFPKKPPLIPRWVEIIPMLKKQVHLFYKEALFSKIRSLMARF